MPRAGIAFIDDLRWGAQEKMEGDQALAIGLERLTSPYFWACSVVSTGWIPPPTSLTAYSGISTDGVGRSVVELEFLQALHWTPVADLAVAFFLRTPWW